MIRILIFCSLFIFNNILTAQVEDRIVLEDHYVPADSLVVIPFNANQIDNCYAFQFSISWNPSSIEFQNIGELGFSSFAETDFGLSNTESGVIRVVWNSTTLEPIFLDDTFVFSLEFKVLDFESDSLEVHLSNDPLISKYVYEDIGGGFQNISLSPQISKLIIPSPLEIELSTQDISCFGFNDGVIFVEPVNGFFPYEIMVNGNVVDNLILDSLVANTNYEIEVLDSLGYSVSDTVLLFEPEEFVLSSIEFDSLTCLNDLTTLDIIVLGGNGNFEYYLDEELYAGDLIGSGEWNIEVVDSLGCHLDTLLIIDPPVYPSFISKLNDLSICPLTSNDLSVSAQNYETINWYLNKNLVSSDSSISLKLPGEYIVELISDDQCLVKDSINVTQIENTILNLDDLYEVCESDTLSINIENTIIEEIMGISNFTFDDGNLFLFNFNEMVSFIDILYLDSLRCYENTGTFQVILNRSETEIITDTCLVSGDIISLSPKIGDAQFWTDLNTNDTIGFENELLTSFRDSTVLSVLLEDDNGCGMYHQIAINVIDDLSELIDGYNVITPNGDNKNDLLIFDGISKFVSPKLVIYNRWGNVIYQDDSYNNNWGGIVDGKLLPTGEYFYTLKVDEVIIKSNFSILYNE